MGFGKIKQRLTIYHFLYVNTFVFYYLKNGDFYISSLPVTFVVVAIFFIRHLWIEKSWQLREHVLLCIYLRPNNLDVGCGISAKRTMDTGLNSSVVDHLTGNAGVQGSIPGQTTHSHLCFFLYLICLFHCMCPSSNYIGSEHRSKCAAIRR